jgi:hypothetical protein
MLWTHWLPISAKFWWTVGGGGGAFGDVIEADQADVLGDGFPFSRKCEQAQGHVVVGGKDSGAVRLLGAPEAGGVSIVCGPAAAG